MLGFSFRGDAPQNVSEIFRRQTSQRAPRFANSASTEMRPFLLSTVACPLPRGIKGEPSKTNLGSWYGSGN